MHSSVYCPTLHILTVERYVGWGRILNSFMCHPYLVLLLSTSYYIFNVFSLKWAATECLLRNFT